jgi:ubiquinone biosynthesis protein
MLNIYQPLRNIQRLREVQNLIFRYGFGFVLGINEVKGIRKKLRLSSQQLDETTAAERLRNMLQELGPTYIKFGQLLASRGDLLPPDWTQELSKLQDQVPAFSFHEVCKVVEKEFGKSIEQVYFEFDEVPIAAASIGQVHHAKLLDMTPVVVKVQRPRTAARVQSDIEIIREIAKLVESRISWGKRYGIVAVFDEFAHALALEMDYRNEATNADRLRHQMASVAHVHVPHTYWNLTTEKVLTMEAIDGIKINDVEALDAAGVDREEMARVFIQCLFHQILVDGFFHSDPHPGNLLICPSNARLVFLDLGQMGRLMPEQLVELSDLIEAVLRRDSLDVTRILLTIGTPFKKIDEHALRKNADYIINRYLDTSLDRIYFSAFCGEILGLINRHGLRLPSEFTMGIKAIIQGEEIARALDPDIKVIGVIHGIYQQLIKKMLNPANMFDILRDGLREVVRLREVLPRAVESILKQLEGGSLTITLQIPEFINITSSLMIIINRLVTGLILVGMFIGSALLLNSPFEKGWGFLRYLGVICFFLAMIFGLMLVGSVILDIWEKQRSKRGPF